MKIRLATKEIIYEDTGRHYAIYLEEGLGIDPIETIDWPAIGFPNYIEPNPGPTQKVTDNLVPFNNHTYTFEVVEMTEEEIKESEAVNLKIELRDIMKAFASDTSLWLIKRELAAGRITLDDLTPEMRATYVRINEIEVKLGI